MDPELYEAALFIPQTARKIQASIQIYSTMHKAYGLMNQVINEAAAREAAESIHAATAAS